MSVGKYNMLRYIGFEFEFNNSESLQHVTDTYLVVHVYQEKAVSSMNVTKLYRSEVSSCDL